MTQEEKSQLHRSLIEKHIEGLKGLEKASVQYFYESGMVSGSLSAALKKYAQEFHDAHESKFSERDMDDAYDKGFADALGIIERGILYKRVHVKEELPSVGAYYAIETDQIIGNVHWSVETQTWSLPNGEKHDAQWPNFWLKKI